MAQSVRTSVVLDQKTHTAAKRAARQLRVSLSRFIECLVELEVLQNPPKRTKVSLTKGTI
jgi:hypothetical protein